MSCIHSTQGHAYAQPVLSFAQSATNHIAAGGLPQRLHYMVPIEEGQTHLPKSGANHAGSPVYGEPSSGIRGRIGDLPQALLSRIWHSDCTIVDNGTATICDIQAGRRCIHSRCAPDDPDSTPAREPIQEAFDWPFCSEPFPHGERLLQSWPLVSFKPPLRFVPSNVAGLGEKKTAPHAALRSAHAENWRNGAKAFRAKVSLAMLWLSAYYWSCLVNRLWVPTTMRSLAFLRLRIAS